MTLPDAEVFLTEKQYLGLVTRVLETVTQKTLENMTVVEFKKFEPRVELAVRDALVLFSTQRNDPKKLLGFMVMQIVQNYLNEVAGQPVERLAVINYHRYGHDYTTYRKPEPEIY